MGLSSQLGIKPTLAALEGAVLTTGLPGKSLFLIIIIIIILMPAEGSSSLL